MSPSFTAVRTPVRLHHPFPARHRAQPARRTDRARSSIAGRARREGSHAARPDCRSVWQRRARRPNLADLLRVVNDIGGVERIRFLTSHPSYMNDQLLDAVAELPKVCDTSKCRCKAGDDQVLENMKRGYTADDLPPLESKKSIEVAEHVDRYRHHCRLFGRNRSAISEDI